ncbi:MAG TPA: hypothetical protein VGB38_04100, partial [bacterium]
MAEFTLPYLPPGTVELKKVLQKYARLGLIIAASIHLLLIGLYWGVGFLSTQAAPPPTRVVKIVKYSELGPPPSVSAREVTPAVS